jgi:hypothetical protein
MNWLLRLAAQAGGTEDLCAVSHGSPYPRMFERRARRCPPLSLSLTGTQFRP